MNIPDVSEVNEKHRRVLAFFDRSGYEAMVIGRQDNFAWYTCGGNNRVINTSENGYTLLVITKTAAYVVSQIMDGPRIFDEELQGLNLQPAFLKWYEQSREEKAAELIKGLRAVSDIPIDGATCAPSDIYNLHYPLTGKEIEKCRWVGAKSDEILRKVADEIIPGMTEHEIEAMLLYEYGKLNMQVDVLLVGSDDRITKYRHPNPSDKKVERLVLLHPAARKWGLHANVTRMVYFGDKLPDDIAHRYDAVCRIQAAAISMCSPGTTFQSILEAEKQVYKETGYEDEWRNHFQGGITGYLLGNAGLCKDPQALVSVNQAFDWFITITGVKAEELSILTKDGPEVPSAAGHWPVSVYEYIGRKLNLPDILVK